MRKVTAITTTAFLRRKKAKEGNTYSDGNTLYLHGNKIAEHRVDGIYITDAGWPTATTKERLNGLPGVHIYQKDFQWYLNNNIWDGKWVKI